RRRRPRSRCAPARSGGGSGSARCPRSAGRCVASSWVPRGLRERLSARRGGARLWEDQREGAAAAALALGLDGATEEARESPADREPEAGALVLSLQPAVELPERLEELREALWRDPDPGVGDR